MKIVYRLVAAAACMTGLVFTSAVVGGAGSAGAANAPIVLGSVDDTQGAAAEPDFATGNAVGVDYINKTLGGVNGHQLNVVTCGTAEDPQTTEACANKVVAANPIALMSLQEFSMDSAIKIYEQDSLPVLDEWPLTNTEYSSKDAFLVVGGDGSEFPAMGQYVLDQHIKKLALIQVNTPQAILATNQPMQVPLEHFGVQVKSILVPLTATDLSPYVQSATSYGAIMFAVTPAQCTSALRALQTLGYSGQKIFAGDCATNSVFSAAGAAASTNTVASAELNYLVKSSDVTTFNNAWAKYGSGPASYTDRLGFALAMNTYNMLKGLNGNYTKAAVTKFMNATNNQANFLAHPYTCNRQQNALFPSVCNPYFKMEVVKGTTLQSSKSNPWYVGTKLLNYAASQKK